jgi:hypothetical protein
MHLPHLPDAINGGFEFFGGAVNWLNVRRLVIDKQLRGVSKIPAIVFTSWGVWNLYYYPYLDQWVSFTGGLVIVAANVVWVWFAWKYRNA